MDSSNNRYLVLIDILGFSDMVTSRSSEEVYSRVDRALQAFNRWETLNGDFTTIHFSDSFLLFQKVPGYYDKAFLDAYAIARILFSALLADGVPARGAIVFGGFVARFDMSGRHQIYFGPALIEAHRAETKEDWIGLKILPSAWKPYDAANPGVIDAFATERVWLRREDGSLLLNPFGLMTSYYWDDKIGQLTKPYREWDAPEFPNEIRAFRFLHDQLEALGAHDSADEGVVCKYQTTVALLRRLLGSEVYEWGAAVARTFDA